MYMFGVLVGAGFNGFLADRFGRLTMITIASIAYTIISVGSAWLPTLSTLIAARFLLGIMHPTSLQTGYILIMEVTEMKMRSRIGILQFISWTAGTMLWGGWAYLVRNWRWLQTMVSLPCLLFLPALWILEESPRWLVVRGHHDRALRVLQKAAAWNNASLPPSQELLSIMKEIELKSASSSSNDAEKTVMDRVQGLLARLVILFRTRKLRIITLVMLIQYFVVAMISFGLTLGAGTFNVNPFLYMTIAGIMELPGTTLLIPLISTYGRKKVTTISFALCAISLMTEPLPSKDYKWLSVTLVMVGKMTSSCAFSAVFLYASELFPTEIRTQGMSSAMMSSRAGAIIAPFLMSALNSTFPWAITVVFGALSLVAAVSSFPLPETLNTDLPDTITDLEGKRSITSKKDTNSGPDTRVTTC
ncbi:organic cation transporter protein-like [Homarus americanus]|uniref:organic cation transporter protein-like n=1 Tax=Homarus americanus TaxID=6706 RepID=UPI001C4478BD|nr:organic cation transporter protein-like [Homarus americanus]